MIPKTIHFCWFGKKRKSRFIKNCIRSWEQKLPDYKIICWTEKNLPVKHPFMEAALKKGYFAFASDFARLYVIQQYGGIYFDTDVLVLKSFDKLLQYDFFLGEELPGRINLAVFGAIPNHPIINRFLKFYDTSSFNSSNLPIISNCLTIIFDEIKHDMMQQNDRVFDANYFYPLPYDKRVDNYENYVVEETFAVHLWNKSWGNVNDLITEKKYISAFAKMINYLY